MRVCGAVLCGVVRGAKPFTPHRCHVPAQAHPNKSHAKELHAARPDVYKDPNHKPEMACAITDFEAMCVALGVQQPFTTQGLVCPPSHHSRPHAFVCVTQVRVPSSVGDRRLPWLRARAAGNGWRGGCRRIRSRSEW